MLTNIEKARLLMSAVEYANEYGLGIEVLATYLSYNPSVPTDEQFRSDVSDALSTWDV